MSYRFRLQALLGQSEDDVSCAECDDAALFGGVDPSGYVQTTSDQTVGGTKTFTTTPVVPNDAWAFSKLPNISAGQILGRVTGSGDIVPLSRTEIGQILFPWVFDVKAYGAVGDGVTDDTTAIRAAVTAATAYAIANETAYAEVWFPPSPSSYVVSSAPLTGANFGNAVIPLPIIADTARKITLVFTGCFDAVTMQHWNQTVGQRWGSTIKCTLTGLTDGGANGAPSVIGGPTPSQGYGVGSPALFNNINVIIEGIGISIPLNPTLGGIDLRGCAQAAVRRVAVTPDASTAAIAGGSPASWSFGYLPPNSLNNDVNILEDFTAYGVAAGFVITEHLDVKRSACIYCTSGIFVRGDTNLHSATMTTVSIEACAKGIEVAGFPGARFPVHISGLSVETISGNAIDDPDHVLHGTVNITSISGYTINGARNCRIIRAPGDLGLRTPPAIPASTVELVNPFDLDCEVQIVGGTFTDITIDGQATGYTNADLPIIVTVRTRGRIAITYSVVPTSWRWWAR